MSNLSNIIKNQRYYEEEDEFGDPVDAPYGHYGMYPRKKPINYKSIFINMLIAIFIFLLFSRTFYNKIEELSVNSGIAFFTKEGEPNILMIALQFIILFILLKIICKY